MSSIVMCTAPFSEVEAIMRDLHASGFSSQDISILVKDRADSPDRSDQQITRIPERDDAGTCTIEGSTCGALSGIGTLAISGVGPLIAVGPIIAGLRRISYVGTAGRLTDVFISMGVPEVLAARYEEQLKSGTALIGVRADEHEDSTCARDIFEYAEAEDISSAEEVTAEHSHSNADRVRSCMRLESLPPWLL